MATFLFPRLKSLHTTLLNLHRTMSNSIQLYRCHYCFSTLCCQQQATHQTELTLQEFDRFSLFFAGDFALVSSVLRIFLLCAVIDTLKAQDNLYEGMEVPRSASAIVQASKSSSRRSETGDLLG